MQLKYKVLEVLEINKHKYISGSSLAKELGVTRASVWKTIEALRKEGYDIPGISKNGYRLEKSGDLLSADGILRHIKTKGVFCVETRDIVTSTNTVLRSEAAKGAPEGYVLAAEAQTEGKGRQGRSWYSPPGHAAYFSVILRPKYTAGVATLITAAASVAVALAIESVFGVQAGIKWVNDLYYNGKKITGIITEATMDFETGMIDNAVLGIGINVTQPVEGYPPELENIITAVTDRTSGMNDERSRLIAATLDYFWNFYIDLEKRDYLDEYRKRSVLLGKRVFVHDTGNEKNATAVAIDDDCGLVIKYDNGRVETLRYGQVRVSI